MAMIMPMDMDTILDLDFSGYSTTTTTTPASDDDYSGLCNWNHWSPVVNWDAFTGAGQDDFHDLWEFMMDETLGSAMELEDLEGCNSGNSTLTEAEATRVDEEAGSIGGGVEDSKGLRLVHLLMAAAEALTGANKSHDLARVILIRLKELVSPTDGSNMERLAAYFTEALHSLLENPGTTTTPPSGSHREDHIPTDFLTAFQLLQDMSPYVKFGHFTANQAIIEAVAHEKRVHIVDYDIMEGTQWASLIQSLASSNNGLPGPHLRITALSRSGTGRKSFASVQETGRRLTAFAASVGQPFSFHQCRLEPNESFRGSNLKLVRGEALVFNCMLHLPHLSYRGGDSVASFLMGAKTLKARLVTLVEEERGVSVSPLGETGFAVRFMESLHHYSAVCDSMEAGFPMQRRARVLVERVFLGPRIVGWVGRIYRSPMEEERGSWGEWLGEKGFRGEGISFANHCQAKLLVGLFNHGYRVEEVGGNTLALSWKSKRLLSASIWSSSSS